MTTRACVAGCRTYRAPKSFTSWRPWSADIGSALPQLMARAVWPVVARGETILWVPGICRSGEGLPEAGTRAVRLDVIRTEEPAEADR